MAEVSVVNERDQKKAQKNKAQREETETLSVAIKQHTKAHSDCLSLCVCVSRVFTT